MTTWQTDSGSASVARRVCLSDGSKRCEMSGFLFDRVACFLKINGYELTRDLTGCETIIINTCCVTESKIQDSKALLERALKQSGLKRIILFGCLAVTLERDHSLERVIRVGPKDLDQLDGLFEHTLSIEHVPQGGIHKDYFSPYQTGLTNDDHYILISQGCVHECSYCNIKRAKGRVVSRTSAEILHEVRGEIAAGGRVFVLLADDCGSYGGDLGTSLTELVGAILELEPKVAVKISTFFPGDFIRQYPTLRPMLATGRITYLNLPIQSGSERILGLMRRGYELPRLLELLQDLRQISPKIVLYTHLLLDFPTETTEDFERSLQVARHFDEVMFITYSDNAHTAASRLMPKVSQAEQVLRAAAAREYLETHAGLFVDSREREPMSNYQAPPGPTLSHPAPRRDGVASPPPHRERARGPTGAAHSVRGHGVVQLALTDRCQCNCSHCGVKHLNREQRGDMPLDQVDAILRDIKVAGFGSVDLFGGEPTLRADLVEVVRRGHAHSLEMLVETNALALDRSYIERLKEAGLFRLYVSLDDCEPEYHDKNRGREVFHHAVEVIGLCRDLDLEAHASIVPRDREYFLTGRINRYLRFCLDSGARRVRILFPSYVGNCSDKARVFCSEQDERSLLHEIDEEFHDAVYVESDFSSLRTIMAGERIPCPAKSIFCHVTSSGLVMPCPYLPLVFGDATRESIAEVFARIMEHPALHQSGIYCPTRDETFMKTFLADVGRDRPYRTVHSENRVDLQARCNNRCPGCQLNAAPRTDAQILRQIGRLDQHYGGLHLYGGEPFVRPGIFSLLDQIPRRLQLTIHSNARLFAYPGAAKRLAGYSIKSIKVPLFATEREAFDRFTRAEGSYDQTLAGIANLRSVGVPVCVYLPCRPDDRDLQRLRTLGAVSVSTYQQSETHPLPDTVMCFGRRVGRTELLWLEA